MAESGDNSSNTLYVSIPFPTAKLAQIAYDVLRIDAEPKRSTVTKNLTLEENLLKLSLSSTELRQIRVSLTSFFDNINLVVDTMEFAGEPISETYSHYEG